MSLKCALAASLLPLASAAASIAAFGLALWLSFGKDGSPPSRGDWLYAAAVAAICLLPGTFLDAFLRARALRRAEDLARREAESAMRAERADWRERLRDAADSRAAWAHELKTPLTALRLALGSGLPDDEFRGLAAAEAGRLENLLELSLFESRAESFDRDYVISEANARRVASEAASALAGAFNAAGLRFELEEFNLTVLTDPRWLAFVLRQLLLNAIKHSPPGTSVTLGARLPSGAGSGEGGVGELYVRDSGPGIAPEDLGRIFERGFTGSSARSGPAYGVPERRQPTPTGMGLYLCKRLCDKLGHGLRAENAPGGGGLFSLSFPHDTGQLDPVRRRLTKT